MTGKDHLAVSVFIDTSIFAGDAAYGRVSGRVTLPTYPQVGDFVSLFPIDLAEAEAKASRPHWILKVLSRTIAVNSKKNDVSLELSEILVSTLEEATQIVIELEKDAQLLIEIY